MADSKRDRFQNRWIEMFEVFRITARPLGAVPQLEVRAYAHQHDFTRQAGDSSQFGGHQYPPRTIHIHILCTTQQQTLQDARAHRSEEHTSELQSLMRISYAVFCLKKKNLTKDKM